LDGRPHEVCYGIPDRELEEHLGAIGQELSAVERVLVEEAPESDILALVTRVLSEQYERGTDGAVRLLQGRRCLQIVCNRPMIRMPRSESKVESLFVVGMS